MEPLTTEQKIEAYNAYMNAKNIKRPLTKEEKARALNVTIGQPTQASVGMMRSLSKLFGPNVLPHPLPTLADDIKTGASNFGASAGNAVGEVYDAIASPIQTMKNVAGIAEMPFSEQGRDALLNAGKETIDVRKRLREDPASILLDLIGLGPLKRVMGLNKLSKVADVADKVNPIKALAKAAGKTPSALGNLGTGILGFTTSKGRRVFDEAFEAGKEGGQRLDAFKGGMRGDIVGENVATDVLAGTRELAKKRGDNFGTKVNEITEQFADMELDLDGVKNDAAQILQKYNIKLGDQDPFKNFGSEVASEKTMVNRALELIGKRDSADPKSMIALHQKLGSINSKAKIVSNSRASAVVGDLQDRVRKELSKIPGYDEMADAYRADSTLLEQIQNTLSTGGGWVEKEQMITKLTNLLNDRDNLDMRRRIVDELEDITGKPLKAQIAGIRTADAIPTGVRATVTTGVGGLMAGAGGVFLTPWMSAPFLLALPFTSPRLMGKMVSSIGESVSVGKIKTIEKAIEQVHKALPPGMTTDGMTLGMVLNQLEQRAQGNDTASAQSQKPTMTQLLSRAQQQRSQTGQPVQ